MIRIHDILTYYIIRNKESQRLDAVLVFLSFIVINGHNLIRHYFDDMYLLKSLFRDMKIVYCPICITSKLNLHIVAYTYATAS